MFGCEASLTAGEQKESFQAVISDTLGEECNYETVKNIHDNLTMLMEEHKDDPEPVMLDKREVKQLLERSGVEDEKLLILMLPMTMQSVKILPLWLPTL